MMLKPFVSIKLKRFFVISFLSVLGLDQVPYFLFLKIGDKIFSTIPLFLLYSCDLFLFHSAPNLTSQNAHRIFIKDQS
jgi:hypothetical protein